MGDSGRKTVVPAYEHARGWRLAQAIGRERAGCLVSGMFGLGLSKGRKEKGLGASRLFGRLLHCRQATTQPHTRPEASQGLIASPPSPKPTCDVLQLVRLSG